MFGKRPSKAARPASSRLGFESLESRVVMSASGIVPEPIDIAHPAAVGSPVTSTAAALLTTEEWVHSLAFWQFDLLAPEHVQFLTPAQVASIPNSGYFGKMSAAARGALNATQVQSLNVGATNIDLLTPQQVGWLTAPQIQSLKFFDFDLLHPTQIQWLTPAQVATIPHSGYLSSWSAQSRAALTAPQVQSLNTETIDISNLTAQQIGWLTAGQVSQIRFYEFRLLQPSQVPWLTAAQIASIPEKGYLTGWSPAARAALTTAQVQSLNIGAVGIDLLTTQQVGWLAYGQVRSINTQLYAVNALTSTQIDWLTVAQIQLLGHAQFHLLKAAQIPSLTTAQIASIPNSGVVAAWTPEARAALTLSQVQSLNIANFEIRYLTSLQISWLGAAQIQKVKFYEFSLLQPAQIPFLTSTQILSIPHAGYLDGWSAAARAALKIPQVQLLNMEVFRATQLTSQQIGWLTLTQVHAMRFYEFHLLSPTQIRLLTTAQIASIPHSGYVATWSVAARAALTATQVQSLNMVNFEGRYLTNEQFSWLTVSQLRNLKYMDFERLSPSQVPWLTAAQLASVPNGSFFNTLPGAFSAALTREQILGLPPEMWEEFTHAVISLPYDYHPAEHMPIGPDGLPIMPHTAAEAARVFALVPLQSATHTTVASGSWSNPAIWSNGVVPTAGAKVVVAAGTTVQFDAFMNTAIKTLRIDGTLSFAVDRNTQLKADTIVVYTTGKLHIGTAANPIRDAFTAKILIADGGPIDTTWDPYLLSRGLISRGEVRMYGKTVTPYAALAVDPMAGDTQLYLSQIPVNWRVGDKIVLTGIHANIDGFGAEERIIRAINGSVVTIDALQYDHNGLRGYGASVHVANLTRNVVLAAEDSSVIAERPHIMFFHNPNVELQNVGVYEFGRTDKSIAINDPVVVNGVLQPGTGTNPRARYAIHFHHTGVNPAFSPADVRGSVVVGSPGWGFVNHSSNVNFDGNVAFGVYGASFTAEDGNEIGAMRGNLSINAEGSREDFEARAHNHDFGIQGNGFWLQGPGVEMSENISAGSRGVGFVIYAATSKTLFDAANLGDPSLAGGQVAVPVSAVPIKSFIGNTAYTAPVALQVWRHMFGMTDGEGVIEDFFSWNTSGGIDVRYSSHLTIRNARLVGNLQEYTGTGIGTITSHDMVFDNVNIEGFHVGIVLPTRRSSVVLGGDFAAVNALYIEKGHDDMRTVHILSPTFATLTSGQLRGRIQHHIYMADQRTATTLFAGQSQYFTQDRVTYTTRSGNSVQLYYAEQMPNYVPYPAATAPTNIPSEYLNKTNQQLINEFGLAFNGKLVWGPAPTNLRIRGFAGSLLVER
jgi:hypothetical protein